jgi:hypothetical protein
VFDSVRLYTPYLGNASNPIVIESVMMGAICHHYKQLLQITKEVISINKDSLTDELVSLLETKPEGKVLFYRFSKIWYNFIYSLHKEDRLILLNMILEICCYSESVSSTLNIQDPQSNINSLSILLAMLLQQKRIDLLGQLGKKKDVTLLDFMYK